MTQSKELSNNVRRAHQKLNELGVDVSYTQTMSAMAAYFGYSNREEWLQANKPQPAAPAADPSESFIDRLMKMTPQELDHANWLIVLTGLKRAMAKIEELGGGHPAWLQPYHGIAAEAVKEGDALELARALPFTLKAVQSLHALSEGFCHDVGRAQTLEDAMRQAREHLQGSPSDVAVKVVRTSDERTEVLRLVRQLDGSIGTNMPALVGWQYVQPTVALAVIGQVAEERWKIQELDSSDLVDLGQVLETALMAGRQAVNCQLTAEQSTVKIRKDYEHLTTLQLYQLLCSMVSREDAFAY
jgi:hypothetical protein